MARLPKDTLLERVIAAISESGWNILHLASVDEHPFILQIFREDESHKLRIYIWNLTHGGGSARPENEYRIQITGTNQFIQTTGEKTLILGWWDEAEVFAGFDVRKHAGVLGSSPSFQIRLDCLQKAKANGFSPCDKGNQEIATAFRSDFFVEYIRNLEALHDFGQSNEDLAVLDTVSQDPQINTEEIHLSSNERKMTVLTVSKKLRDVNFRKRVLTAYETRCAVCGLQLRLVDAAHIIPVYHHNSTDETRNGLALCTLHHRAYDQALVTVWDDYSVRLNSKQTAELRKAKEDGGLDTFRKNLLPTILLPHAVTDRPHVEYIRLANRIRNWPDV
jgi:putative restriction endonuclease